MIEQTANHLWQSSLVAVLAGLLTLIFKRHRAQVRYWLWLAASLKFLIPFAALAALGHQLGWRLPNPLVQPQLTLAVDAVAQPFSQPVRCRGLGIGSGRLAGRRHRADHRAGGSLAGRLRGDSPDLVRAVAAGRRRRPPGHAGHRRTRAGGVAPARTARWNHDADCAGVVRLAARTWRVRNLQARPVVAATHR